MPKLKTIKSIVAKFVNGPDRYVNLTFDELATYYRFAVGGYVGNNKFVYADAQSNAKYVDGELLLKYLTTLKEKEGLGVAQKEYRRFESLGYLYTCTIYGRVVFHTSEAEAYLKQKFGDGFQNILA